MVCKTVTKCVQRELQVFYLRAVSETVERKAREGRSAEKKVEETERCETRSSDYLHVNSTNGESVCWSHVMWTVR